MPKLCRSRARLHFNRITRYIYLPRHTTSLNPRPSTIRNFAKITPKPGKLSHFTKHVTSPLLRRNPNTPTVLSMRKIQPTNNSSCIALSKYEVYFSSHDIIQFFYSRAFHALPSFYVSLVLLYFTLMYEYKRKCN